MSNFSRAYRRHSISVYMSTYIYIYIHTYIHTFTYIHICICICRWWLPERNTPAQCGALGDAQDPNLTSSRNLRRCYSSKAPICQASGSKRQNWCIIYCILYIILYTIHYILYSIYYTLYIIFYILNTIYYILYILYILYSGLWN